MAAPQGSLTAKSPRFIHVAVDNWRNFAHAGAAPERLTHTYLEQVSVNREYRDLVGFLRSARYLHLVPQLVREPDRSVGPTADPYGGDFLKQIARTPKRTADSRLRRIEHSAVAVLTPPWSTKDLMKVAFGCFTS